ncbi:DUF302 domain-containing protein [Hippea alviniae]|uniref:DUF302 domain-containing protein n=1 Tax=Hippea alviniae TaxID=1279027 RepID=UPI0003B40192|nr:DUF302 domain-containing protein [Hippea alviniae]
MKILHAIGGAAIGAASLGALTLKLFQTQMVKEIPSPKNFEETCKAIEKVIPQFSNSGWGFPFEKWNFYKVFEDRNIDVPNIRKLTVYFVCNANLAARVINTNNAMAGIMPCSWAVMEKADGKTYISKMNIGLMAKMFTGEIKKAMLEVEKTEKEMFKRIFS